MSNSIINFKKNLQSFINNKSNTTAVDMLLGMVSDRSSEAAATRLRKANAKRAHVCVCLTLSYLLTLFLYLSSSV